MTTVRYCRECQQETRNRRSEPDPMPYPRSWSWVLLVPVVWLVTWWSTWR
jgi:hypothetical protein